MRRLIIFVLSVFAISLQAQEPEPDRSIPAYTEAAPRNADPGYKLSGYFNNTLYRANDADLRATDNASYVTVQDTDDALVVGYMELGLVFQTRLQNLLDFYVDFYRVGYWGNDSLEYGSDKNAFYFREARFSLPLFSLLKLSLGRQRLTTTAADGLHDNYVLDDLGDALLVDVSLGMFGVKAFVDLYSMNSPSDAIYDLRTARHTRTVPFFEGDVNILRWGLIPWLKPAKGIEISPYLLFSRVGAVHSGNTDSGGAEESGAGSTGNFADNDWLLVMGADAWYGIGPVSAYAALAWSTGRDRRNLLRPDVEISGLLLHLSAVLRMDWLKFGTSYVHAGGAETDAAGEYLNYGFVSFKGDKLGGMLFRRFYGSNPSAVLDYGGIRIRPYDASRRAGTSAFSLTAAIEDLDLGSFSRSRDKSGLAAVVSAWFYWDTSSSGADFDASLPADVLDQRRLGKYLGYEINLGIAYAFKQAVLEIGFEWGIFIPYDFFLYPVSIAAAPYGNAPLTGFMLFSKMNF